MRQTFREHELVDELVLADLTLTSGSSVLAFGSVQHPGAQVTTLWLANPVDPERPSKLHGGDIEIHFRTPLNAPRSGSNALVAGTWDGERILSARWISAKQNKGAFIPAPPDSRPAISVPQEESESVFLELDRLFEAVLLSSGGSRLRSYVQARNVVPGMGGFFDKLYERKYPLDLYVSIMPASE
ncbi:MAG: hypothetical protein L0H93_20470 [Nocardioides sp.]|nr:hypothetical protein [Nocardioides sp.]